MTTDQAFKGAPDDETRERKIIEENGQELALIAGSDVGCAYLRTLQEKHQKMQQECAQEMEKATVSVAKLDKMERGQGWNLNPHLGYWFKILPAKEVAKDIDANGISGSAATGDVAGHIGPDGGTVGDASEGQQGATV